MTRLSLPTRWRGDQPARLRLLRRFGRPRHEPAREELFLKLDEIRGTCAIVLNGISLAATSPERSHYEIPLDNLRERNVLILEVNLHEFWHGSPASDLEWGTICLVIRERGQPRGA
jgi:hypothetical protein